MQNFPLRQFLLDLEERSDYKIRLTVSDYERVLRAFNSGGRWNLNRLKHTLCALLAKDEDQQRLIEREFEREFDRVFAPELEVPELDIRQVVEELCALPSQTPLRPPPPEIVKAPETPPKSSFKKNPPARRIPSPTTIALLLGLSLCATLGLWSVWKWWNTEPVPRGPELQLLPRHLAFNEQEAGKESEKPLRLHNSGNETLTIQDIHLKGRSRSDFYLDESLTLPMSLEPNKEYPLKVRFKPLEESCRDDVPEEAEVEIVHNGGAQPDIATLQGLGVMTIDSGSPTRLYTDVPTVQDIQYPPLARSRLWLLPAGLFLLFLSAVGGYSVYLKKLEQGPQDREPEIDRTNKHKMFRPGAIGGAPKPWLDDKTLGELADSMGYFRSEEPGRRLDVSASIRATVRGGGIPVCAFLRRSRLRTLLILEDAGAEALEWNPLAGELAAGMRRCGVPVVHGRFHGTPESFLSDGQRYYLEDLEDQRRGILLLIFSDGHSLYRPRNRFAFENLVHWPMAAWMELQGAHSQPEDLQALFGGKMPVFPATREGLLHAIKSFLSERGQIPPGPPLKRGGTPFPESPFSPFFKGGPGGILGINIEQILGEALPWAQECSLMQPMPLGLADALRLRFHEHLPPERIEALYALPNTMRTAAGLRFSDGVQADLRRGLLKRRSEANRQEVLRFIEEHLADARPETPADSLAFLSWEARRVLLRLEMGADPDLKRFGELLQSPLRRWLGDSLKGYRFADDERSEGIPLLIKTPKSVRARQRLSRIRGNALNLPPIVTRRHTRIHRTLALLCMLCGLAAGLAFFRIPPFKAGGSPLNVSVSGQTDAPARLDIWTNDTWQRVGEWEHARELNTISLAENPHYRLRLYGDGVWVDFETLEIRAGTQTQVTIVPDKIEKDCRQDLPEIGLRIERCPAPALDTTQAPQAPVSRVQLGLEISAGDDDSSRTERERLLRHGRFDLIYRLTPATDGEWHVEEALDAIRGDLWPWIAESTLSWWTAGADPEQLAALLQREGFDTVSSTSLEALVADLPSDSSPPPPAVTAPLKEWIEEKLTGMEFVKIPGGCFDMGQSEAEKEQLIKDLGKDDYEKYYTDELPQHEVCLEEFWMGRYEVTQQEWERLMEENPSSFTREQLGKDTSGHPVEGVSWDDVHVFLDKLNLQPERPSDLPDGRFYLPSEAQWEYACRAGTDTPFYFRDTISTDQANYNGNYVYGAGQKGEYREQTTRVGSFPPNAFGLYDMHGNVWEWNQDAWHDSYEGAPNDGSVWEGENNNNKRLLRGGSWNINPRPLRCANRFRNFPENRYNDIGFRVLVSSPRTP